MVTGLIRGNSLAAVRLAAEDSTTHRYAITAGPRQLDGLANRHLCARKRGESNWGSLSNNRRKERSADEESAREIHGGRLGSGSCRIYYELYRGVIRCRETSVGTDGIEDRKWRAEGGYLLLKL